MAEAKYARLVGRKLSIAYEGTGATEDRLVEDYFKGLRENGTGFEVANSSKHKPLTKDELAETLLSIWPDGKKQSHAAIGRSVVHPLDHHPTGSRNRAYDRLSEAGQIIDLRSNGDETIAIKYS